MNGRTSKTTEPKRPYHIGVTIGISAGMYAASLAVVSGLQFEADRDTIADRQPVVDAIAMLSAHHEDLADRLEAARTSYTDATGEFGSVAEELKAVHEGLTALARDVAALDRYQLAQLPSVTVPRFRPQTAPGPVAKPPPPQPHTQTGASG
ncbi:MAG TPA: hypothetical protein VH723_00460 [Candidatus Limnocylindrales bacterium]|jgi:hypothetical protein